MREIKFRCWDIVNKKMRSDKDLWDIPYNEIFIHTPDQRALNIMQYTGLKDKNGTKIYEGDIIPYHLNENIKGIVKFGEYRNPCDSNITKHQGFYVEFPGDLKDYYRKDLGYWARASKVIGNTYENPELLE